MVGNHCAKICRSRPHRQHTLQSRGSPRTAPSQPNLRARRGTFPDEVGPLTGTETSQDFLDKSVRLLFISRPNLVDYPTRWDKVRDLGETIHIFECHRRPIDKLFFVFRRQIVRLDVRERPVASQPEPLARSISPEKPMQRINQNREIRLPRVARADEHGEGAEVHLGLDDGAEVLHFQFDRPGPAAVSHRPSSPAPPERRLEGSLHHRHRPGNAPRAAVVRRPNPTAPPGRERPGAPRRPAGRGGGRPVAGRAVRG